MFENYEINQDSEIKMFKNDIIVQNKNIHYLCYGQIVASNERFDVNRFA